MMNPSVELRCATKRFGVFVAVDRVDLHVLAGEFLTLLGPSGCGKTTILRMIAGFEQPTEGAVLLDGRDVTGVPPYKRDVNQVFQSYALFPHLSVRDNIAFGLRMKRVASAELRERVEQAVELVALKGMENRMPSQLSGGQRQRVALARAVVNRPKVLLLDEPLGALDAELRRAMQIELKRLQRSLGITFVFVTHDQEEALTMSDRIAVVNRGRIEQIDAAEAIYQRPATAFVARFLGGGNVLPCERVEGDGSRIRLAGSIEWVVQNSVTTGATLFASVRPERVCVHRDSPAHDVNVLQVQVVEHLFRGASDQLLLRSADGLELQAVVPAAGMAGQPLRRGDAAYARIDPGDIVLVK